MPAEADELGRIAALLAAIARRALGLLMSGVLRPHRVRHEVLSEPVIVSITCHVEATARSTRALVSQRVDREAVTCLKTLQDDPRAAVMRL